MYLADNVDSHEPDSPLPQQIVPIQSRHQQQQTTNGCSPSGEGTGTDVCHANAVCEPLNHGHCCKCLDGIGNGKDCASKGKP